MRFQLISHIPSSWLGLPHGNLISFGEDVTQIGKGTQIRINLPKFGNGKCRQFAPVLNDLLSMLDILAKHSLCPHNGCLTNVAAFNNRLVTLAWPLSLLKNM